MSAGRPVEPDGEACLRIDRLVWMLRFARSRSAAQAIVATGHLRRNGQRITRAAQPVFPGDVLTLPVGTAVRVIELLSLPTRRGPAREACSHYRELTSNVSTGPAGFTLDAGSEQP